MGFIGTKSTPAGAVRTRQNEEIAILTHDNTVYRHVFACYLKPASGRSAKIDAAS